MKKNGFVKVEIIVILSVFTLAYFIIMNKISYNFNVDYEIDLYNLTIASIEEQAALYGRGNETIFVDNDTVYMSVSDLAQEGAIVSSSEGTVIDPRDDTKTLNDLRVKIVKKNSRVTAEVLGV